jgi:transposase
MRDSGEACAGAHHWARQLLAHGYRVKIMAPQYLRSYVLRNKNDVRDADCKAMGRRRMLLVPIKTIEQQDVQAVHRIRTGLVEQRTFKSNQIRSLITEYGLVAPKELSWRRRAIPCWPPN